MSSGWTFDVIIDDWLIDCCHRHFAALFVQLYLWIWSGFLFYLGIIENRGYWCEFWLLEILIDASIIIFPFLSFFFQFRFFILFKMYPNSQSSSFACFWIFSVPKWEYWSICNFLRILVGFWLLKSKPIEDWHILW